jgi:hypothetical protein
MSDNGLTVTQDGMWGAPCLGYNILGVLPDAALNAIARMQHELHGAGLPAFNPCPRGSLHISIYALVSVRSPTAGKQDYWASVAKKALADLERLCRDRPSIALHVTEIRLTPTAIIAVARAVPDLVDDIRAYFSKWPAQPGWIRPNHDIAHVTLARFSAAGLISAALVRDISARPMSLETTVSRIQLVRERVYPCLEIDVISSLDLPKA